MTGTFPTVDPNPWLLCSLAFTLLVLAPGLAWSWLFPWLADAQSGWRRKIQTLTLILLAGFSTSCLTALALAAGGALSAVSLFATVAGISGAGLLLGRGKFSDVRRTARDLAPGALVLAAGFSVIMLLPQRGEWIMGGWDPGVYVNQGIHIARHGTLHESPLPWHEFLSQDDYQLFTRGNQTYREIAPAVLVDPATGKLEHYFFRFMPAVVATLDLCGGMRAAVRVSDFMALCCLVTFAGLLVSWRRATGGLIATVSFLATQPVWLYHAHLPTTEMLHLFLTCGMGFLLAWRNRDRTTPALLGVIIFVAALNRFDTIVFSALLIAAIAVLDFARSDRRAVFFERTLLIGGLLLGARCDVLLSGKTLVCIAGLIPFLWGVTWKLLAAAIVIDIAASIPKLRAALLRPQRLWSVALAAGIVAFAAFVCIFPHVSIAAKIITTLTRIGPYLGIVAPIAAVLGLIALIGGKKTTPEERIFTLYLLAASLALLIENHIAPVNPWSTRRFLPCLIPALALLAGGGVTALLAVRGRLRIPALLAGLLLLHAIPLTARQSLRQAWQSTEYNGVSSQLARVAERIPPGDLLITDHHWWVTPLTLIYDRPALNGGLLAKKGDPAFLTNALAAVKRWHGAGKQIWWLTSTKEGLGIYGQPVPGAVLEWTSEPFTLREVAQDKRATGFETRERNFIFRLHRWQPE